jgi:hypothetical protein
MKTMHAVIVRGTLFTYRIGELDRRLIHGRGVFDYLIVIGSRLGLEHQCLEYQRCMTAGWVSLSC